MKILHLAAGNRWTGAAAPAFAEVEALRGAGIEAHYAYVGGYKLQAKIGHLPFTHPVIEKAQNPLAFARTAAALRALLRQHAFDVIHSHLTYDHWLALAAARGGAARVARTFHSRRVLRVDPVTRLLARRTDHLFVINDAFRDATLVRGRKVVFTPPPLDLRQFSPEGASARQLYGLAATTPLVTVIGKLSKGRGFEEALRTFASLRELMAGVKMMIIGHGEHRPVLEALAAELGLTGDVIWAGYHEDDLAEHYRASDLLLFTARGSDEGHRAVLEALACGVPVATFPIEGVSALLRPQMISAAPEPASLARVAAALLVRDRASLRAESAGHARAFGYEPAARRLVEGYR